MLIFEISLWILKIQKFGLNKIFVILEPNFLEKLLEFTLLTFIFLPEMAIMSWKIQMRKNFGIKPINDPNTITSIFWNKEFDKPNCWIELCKFLICGQSL